MQKQQKLTHAATAAFVLVFHNVLSRFGICEGEHFELNDQKEIFIYVHFCNGYHSRGRNNFLYTAYQFVCKQDFLYKQFFLKVI